MKKILVFILLLSILSISSAFGWQKYDSRSGNSYSGYGSSVNGYNTNTGSSWNTNYGSSGMSGTDSRGNSWSYDRGTGVYQNYGTGETRYHKRGY